MEFKKIQCSSSFKKLNPNSKGRQEEHPIQKSVKFQIVFTRFSFERNQITNRRIDYVQGTTDMDNLTEIMTM